MEIKLFSASWCSPCKMLKQTLDKIKEENPTLNYTIIDIDDNPEDVSKNSVRSVPTLIKTKGGVVEVLLGVKSKQELEVFMEVV